MHIYSFKMKTILFTKKLLESNLILKSGLSFARKTSLQFLVVVLLQGSFVEALALREHVKVRVVHVEGLRFRFGDSWSAFLQDFLRLFCYNGRFWFFLLYLFSCGLKKLWFLQYLFSRSLENDKTLIFSNLCLFYA